MNTLYHCFLPFYNQLKFRAITPPLNPQLLNTGTKIQNSGKETHMYMRKQSTFFCTSLATSLHYHTSKLKKFLKNTIHSNSFL